MKKIVLWLCLFVSFAYSGLINGVAVVVGDEPITLLEIEKKREKLGISRDEAIDLLIDEKIKKSKIDGLDLKVEEYEIDKRIELIARQNNLSSEEMKEVFASKYMSWEKYKEDIKQSIMNEKMSKIVLANELVVTEEEDIKLYYENNKNSFTNPTHLKIVQYVGGNKTDLEDFKKNPMFMTKNITSEEQQVEVKNLHPKLAAILLSTKEGSFSPVFPSNGRFFTILIKKRVGESVSSYEKVKNRIRDILQENNRKKAIENYFLKERGKVKIREIR